MFLLLLKRQSDRKILRNTRQLWPMLTYYSQSEYIANVSMNVDRSSLRAS